MSETSKATRPSFCTDKMLVYLDELRDSGITNMFGAGRYLQEEFPELNQPSDGFHCKRAGEVLAYWMKAFAERRAAK